MQCDRLFNIGAQSSDMRRALLAVALLLIVIGGVVLYRQFAAQSFDTGGRYDPSSLDNMDVIYADRDDIYAFNEGYSESEDCPWAFVHNGIDYFFRNGSPVLAAAPGLVVSITTPDRGAGQENRYHVTVQVRFNASIVLLYNFEPWTDDPDSAYRQLRLLNVAVGDWVERGERIATFLYLASGAHIHFGVIKDSTAVCPRPFFSQGAYSELMGLVHTYHPDWELCYP